MKKSTYIWIGIAVVALAGAAFFYFRYRKQRRILNTPSQLKQISGIDPVADASFTGLNYNQVLDPDSEDTHEIKVLQLFLQKFEPSVKVTGVYDDQTQAAVLKITGKPTTTLYEFRYEWMVPYFGDDVAEGIINAYTGKEGQ